MKKSVFSMIMMLVVIFSNSNAQNEDYKSTICLDAGFSLVGALFNSLDINSDATYKSHASPAIQLTYDYSIVKWFSVGAAGSIQMMGADIDYQGEQFGFNVTRMNLAFRPLFHYGNFGKIDMYSGLRFGMTNWNTNVDANTTDFSGNDSFKGTFFAPQLILFGLRGYFTDNFGINFETAVGAPHFFAIGLNYRL